MPHLRTLLHACITALLCLAAPLAAEGSAADPQRFTIAVIPDTQYYVDFTHQTEAGFPFDAREMFYDQMRFIADNARSAGGQIAFATCVGDVWQHALGTIDQPHRDKGLKALDMVPRDALPPGDERTKTIELPVARKGFAMIAGKLPFAVVPGNHDYDHNWQDSRYLPGSSTRPPTDPALPYGLLHYGGLENFNSVFGATTPFFKGQKWYVAAYHGGADSAQVFTAGGYRFLHIGLELAPEDDVIRWAQGVIDAHKGLPTIITIHNNISPDGVRTDIPIVDFKLTHPEHNDPEELWAKLIAPNDQIFLILSGHQYGQAHILDRNRAGHEVHQVLADYQERHQTLTTADPDSKRGHVGIGDGWLRLMDFDMRGTVPRIGVRAYSTHYKAQSGQLPAYAAFYKADEKPRLSDAAFLAEDGFDIDLGDFRARFAAARLR
ncbi:serine/threonine protein phosphatase [Sphingobium aquiterrae]|uniref:serine/threonine protein phosphatase n=1 Tax=Sphingobium aquiterrae TaxID=2038656 RepID=UPI00301806BC